MDSVTTAAIELAAQLSSTANAEQTRTERADAARMARMMTDPAGKSFTLAMADRVFRSRDRARQAGRLQELVHERGVPKYLSGVQRALLTVGEMASKIAPATVMAGMQRELRRASSRVILDSDPNRLANYIRARHAGGTRVNVNQLGEAILSEAEAERRLHAIVGHIQDPLIDYVSVKISAIYSQINILDWDNTLAVIKDRLRILYRAALPSRKFVNLDMEEYRDLELTLAAFQQVLDESEFIALSAGIVLQAYLPDSWSAQNRLTDWARRRVSAGGAAIKVRIVKGANLAMERVEAELHGWHAAPYATKAETDANFRRMLEFGCRPENAEVVRLGVASHNLFDLALALVLREESGVQSRVELEMLEGMANHQARAVQRKAGGLLVYAPAVSEDDFLSALAYLVRRLDENTAPENFLHDIFDLRPGTVAWERQQARFIAGWERRAEVPAASRRSRLPSPPTDGAFYNASDTDWTQADRRNALRDAIAQWRQPMLPEVPTLDEVLASTKAAQPDWEKLGPAPRAAVLRKAADVMEAARFSTISQILHETKKAAFEADVEVSEAVDFARYVAGQELPPAAALGIVVVTPPWNFPYAIPCGNVVHALMAGNSVVLKPAPEAVGVAWHLVCHLWEAGVPRDVLQFYACADGEIGRALITDPRVAAVVLTGAYDTARMFLDWRPTLRLMAEASGKNAIVVTAQADRDLAIKDIVKSAFGHAGQKCSAASLAVLEAEVYDDPVFRRALKDAAASLHVGPATNLGSVVTPLIREPSPNLLRALTTLEAGESWLLEPKRDANDTCLWSPGIKLGVRPGSWFHQTECFGPVLGLMRAADLGEAIAIQNATPFGLTGGIQSLDEREIEEWTRTVQVGNAYVNRPITGAIVRRQPFGGWKRSSIGQGSKMGGPNYLASFMTFGEVVESTNDFQKQWDDIFSKVHDPSALICESNMFCYRPCSGVLLRHDGADTMAIELATLAATVCGLQLHISDARDESDAALAARLPLLAGKVEFLRTFTLPSDALLRAAYNAGLNWICAPMSNKGSHELSRWLREQSVSVTRHRYGLIETPLA